MRGGVIFIENVYPYFCFQALETRAEREERNKGNTFFLLSFCELFFFKWKDFLESIFNISFMKGHKFLSEKLIINLFVWYENIRFKTFLKEDDNLHCFIISNCVYLQYWIVWNTKNFTITVKPLITNTSKEFIKCRILHSLIMECCRYLVF